MWDNLDTMLKDLGKILLFSKATLDVIKEKVESKACDLAIQVKNFTDKIEPLKQNENNGHSSTSTLKEKAKEELFILIGEINHRAQINEVQLKGFIKEKLTELTNNALLDSMELNDIRSEIASLRTEISELKSELNLTKTA